MLSTVTSSLGNTFVIFVYVAFSQIAHCLKYLEMKILEKILVFFVRHEGTAYAQF